MELGEAGEGSYQSAIGKGGSPDKLSGVTSKPETGKVLQRNCLELPLDTSCEEGLFFVVWTLRDPALAQEQLLEGREEELMARKIA